MLSGSCRRVCDSVCLLNPTPNPAAKRRGFLTRQDNLVNPAQMISGIARPIGH